MAQFTATMGFTDSAGRTNTTVFEVGSFEYRLFENRAVLHMDGYIIAGTWYKSHRESFNVSDSDYATYYDPTVLDNSGASPLENSLLYIQDNHQGAGEFFNGAILQVA